MKLRAVLDIGSNSVQMLVVDCAVPTAPRPVADHTRITGLAAGLDSSGRLSAAGRRRTLDLLAEWSAEMRRLEVGRAVAIGTECLRRADDGAAFAAEIHRRYGLSVEIVSGEEEARYSFLGALETLGAEARDRRVVVFDIGGASTEIVLGEAARPVLSRSLPLGARVLSEVHLRSDPPTPAERDALCAAVHERLAQLPPLERIDELVGLGGSVTTLGAVFHRLRRYDAVRVGSTRLDRDQVSALIDDLAGRDLAHRNEVPGLEPGRAEIILGGALTALCLMDHLGCTRVRLSDKGLRHGVLRDRFLGGTD